MDHGDVVPEPQTGSHHVDVRGAEGGVKPGVGLGDAGHGVVFEGPEGVPEGGRERVVFGVDGRVELGA